MKVLVVIDSLSFGGAENVLVTLAGEAPRLGLELDVVSLAPPTNGRAAWLERLQDAGLRPQFLGIERLTQRDAVPRLAAAVRASGADVVHAHLETASTLAPLAARLARRPALCTLHHVPNPLAGRAALRERLAVAVGSRSAGMLMVSQAAYDGFAARYPWSHRPARWRVVHNGVDLDRFRPLGPGDDAALPPEFGIPVGAPVAALVAHMRPLKGHETALRAWTDVLRDHADAHLLFVGDGPLEADLQKLAAELGVGHRVVFAGSRSDVQELLPRVTLALLPTRTEALPTALMEASAAGVPSVATAVGGVPEVVADGETGWLVGAAEPEAFAPALRAALADPAELQRRGRAARIRAEQLFDARSWAENLAALYRAVAAGRTVGRL